MNASQAVTNTRISQTTIQRRIQLTWKGIVLIFDGDDFSVVVPVHWLELCFVFNVHVQNIGWIFDCHVRRWCNWGNRRQTYVVEKVKNPKHNEESEFLWKFDIFDKMSRLSSKCNLYDTWSPFWQLELMSQITWNVIQMTKVCFLKNHSKLYTNDRISVFLRTQNRSFIKFHLFYLLSPKLYSVWRPV